MGGGDEWWWCMGDEGDGGDESNGEFSFDFFSFIYFLTTIFLSEGFWRFVFSSLFLLFFFYLILPPFVLYSLSLFSYFPERYDFPSLILSSPGLLCFPSPSFFSFPFI